MSTANQSPTAPAAAEKGDIEEAGAKKASTDASLSA